jgi:hypothetical protein
MLLVGAADHTMTGVMPLGRKPALTSTLTAVQMPRTLGTLQQQEAPAEEVLCLDGLVLDC